jgi:hypothetical protein
LQEIINIFNNYFISNLYNEFNVYSILCTVPLIRSYSSVKGSVLKFKPELIALDHINSGKVTTSLIINKILLNQNLSVSESRLEELLKVKGVEINIPILSSEDMKLLDELTGKSKYKGFFGVYFFIHKITNQKYVGSSNLLRRRMDYYFKEEYLIKDKQTLSKFLQLLHKEGLAAFKLIIYKLNENRFTSKDALILEQFYLLNKEFNLNTLKVVNAGSSKGDGVYIYDLSCSTLLYHAKSRIELKRVLKIHPESCKIYIDSKLPYLNKFILLSFSVPTAIISNISVQTLINIMQEERQNSYIIGTRRNIPVELKIKEGNTFIKSGETKPQTLKFNSLTSCIEFLRELGLIIKRDTLTKYIKNEIVFHNFLCKYSDKDLPDNFKELGLIIDEYKKVKEDINLNYFKVNIQKKPLLVKGDNFEREFKSITDTLTYFNSLNIKLDRKTLNIHLKNGKLYKNYYFSYK